MREEIRKLFPLEFYINDKEEMVSEISINTLNKLSDEVMKLEYQITNLQQENKKLSKEIKKIKKEDDKIRDKNGFLVNGFHELEQRINKAIEFLREECSFDGDYYCDDLYCGNVKKLVDILEGDTNEKE